MLRKLVLTVFIMISAVAAWAGDELFLVGRNNHESVTSPVIIDPARETISLSKVNVLESVSNIFVNKKLKEFIILCNTDAELKVYSCRFDAATLSLPIYSTSTVNGYQQQGVLWMEDQQTLCLQGFEWMNEKKETVVIFLQLASYGVFEERRINLGEYIPKDICALGDKVMLTGFQNEKRAATLDNDYPESMKIIDLRTLEIIEKPMPAETRVLGQFDNNHVALFNDNSKMLGKYDGNEIANVCADYSVENNASERILGFDAQKTGYYEQRVETYFILMQRSVIEHITFTGTPERKTLFKNRSCGLIESSVYAPAGYFVF